MVADRHELVRFGIIGGDRAARDIVSLHLEPADDSPGSITRASGCSSGRCGEGSSDIGQNSA
jgi:hypothetical protein